MQTFAVRGRLGAGRHPLRSALHPDQVVFEPCRVSHQVGQRNGFSIGVWQLQAPEVLIYVGVQVEPSLLDKLQRGQPGKHFGDGGDPKSGRIGIDASLRVHVGDAIAFGKCDAAIRNDRHDGAGDTVPLKLVRD